MRQDKIPLWKTLLLGWCFALITIPASAQEQALTMDDFAYGMPIVTTHANSLYQVNLPVAVYQTVVYPDLSDIRMFNKAGHLIPFAIQTQPDVEIKTKKVPFFPIYGPDDNVNDLALQVKSDKEGAIIAVQAQDKKPDDHFLGYLIDLDELQHQTVRKLTLRWQSKRDNWIAKAEFYTSDDLAHWQRNWRWQGTLSQLSYQGNDIVGNTLTLDGTIYQRYLLINGPDFADDFVLEKVTASVAAVDDVVTYRLPLTPIQPQLKPDEFVYDTGSYISVSEIALASASDSFLLRADIFSRQSPGDVWQKRSSAMFYQLLLQDTRVSQMQTKLTPTNDRYWMIRVKDLTALDGKPLSISLGWHPAKLTFLAQGESPYILAYGSGDIQVRNNSMSTVLRDIEQKNTAIAQPAVMAEVGAPITLGGQQALTKTIDKVQIIRQVILWAILLLGVLLVGWMVVRLIKQMD